MSFPPAFDLIMYGILIVAVGVSAWASIHAWRCPSRQTRRCHLPRGHTGSHLVRTRAGREYAWPSDQG